MMTAIAERIPNLEGVKTQDAPLFATAMPTLWPHMLLPRAKQKEMPYPFDQPNVRYFYLARNGVYELAHLLGLSGQEVLFPAYFQGVELEALLAAGVHLRFFPVHEKMQVNASEVEAMIGPQTRAIYMIHYAGFPGPVEELSEVCRKRNLFLIEDCALALLSRLGDKPLGSIGDAAVYCIYKMMAAPHGAAMVVRGGAADLPKGESPSLISLASYVAKSVLLNLETRGSAVGRMLRRAAASWGDAALRAAHTAREPVATLQFDLSRVKLAMSDFTHTALNAQDFSGIVENRRRNYTYLLDRLHALSPPVFGALPKGVCPLFYPFQIREKQEAQRRLRARGVEALDFWHWSHPVLPEGLFPVVDELRQTVLWVPCHQDLTPAAISRVADAVQEVVEEMP
jgi:dTDP-4-amino-4,6-dideoxygalactose transaminase